MKAVSIIFLIACVAWQGLALPQDDSEPRASPARGLLKRGLLAKGKATTTTTPAPPQEDIEYEDDAEYPAEGEVQEPSSEAPPSSTEGKKLVAGGVRPFRSNTDLLEALKRRRAQAAEAKLHGPTTSAPRDDAATEAPVKANFSKKRFSSPKESTGNNEEAAAAPAKPSRSRFGRPSSRSVQEPENEEQLNDASPPARSGRAFSRRGSY